MRITHLFLILTACFALLAGCAAIDDNETAAKLGVTYATLKLVDQDTEKALRVCKLAGDAKSFFDSQTLPIIEIEQLIRGEINWQKLDAADALLAETLIAVSVETIKDKSQEGLIDPETRVTASKVLSWIQSVSC